MTGLELFIKAKTEENTADEEIAEALKLSHAKNLSLTVAHLRNALRLVKLAEATREQAFDEVTTRSFLRAGPPIGV